MGYILYYMPVEILILLLLLLLLLLFVFIITIPFNVYLLIQANKIKKLLDAPDEPFRLILNAEKWKVGPMVISNNSFRGMRSLSLDLVGIFQNRKIYCTYQKVIPVSFSDPFSKSYLQLYLKCRPEKIIHKKFFWYTSLKEYPFVYKSFRFDGTVVYSYFDKGIVSKEEAQGLLEDLVRACEIAENGEYEI